VRLTKSIRLTVYGYLDLKTVVVKMGSLSKGERDNLANSEIVRNGKHFVLNIDNKNKQACWLHEGRLDVFY